MAEAEVKTINGKSVCDETAREMANAAVKTVNGVSPDENGNVVVSADEKTIRAYVEEMLIGFVRENWTLTYTDLGKSLLQISVSNTLSTQWSFTLEDDSIVTRNIGYQDGMIDFTKLLMLEIPEGKVRLVQNGDATVWERASYPEKRPFSVMSWSEIGVVCEAGLASEYWSIGDEKTIALSTGEEITLQICAFDHDVGEDNNPLPMTLIMKHLMEEGDVFSGADSVSWKDSTIREKLNNTIYPTLPDDLRALIKPAVKVSAVQPESYDVMETSDKLWLFSLSEIMSTVDSDCYTIEGNRYSLYFNEFRNVKYVNNGEYNGSNPYHSWWTRSRRIDSNYSDYVAYMYGSNSFSDQHCSYSCGICLGLCI